MSEVISIRGQRHEVHECISCGVIYTCPEVTIQHQREHGGFHTCSNGHQQGWNKDGSEIEKLRRERDRLRQDAARKDDEIAAKARELDAERKKAKRVAKRAAAGVCQCCQRTFTNVALHMKHMHPGFTAEAKAPLKLVK